MRVRGLAMCAVLMMGTAAMRAQMPMSSAKAGDRRWDRRLTPVKAIDSQLDLIEGELMGAAKAMPAKYDFAPSQAIFAPGQKTGVCHGADVRGQQAAHVAQANYFFYSTVSGLPLDARMNGDQQADEEGRDRGCAGGLVLRMRTRRLRRSQRRMRLKW